MSKRLVFLVIGFLILAGLAGIFGIIYFDGGDDGDTAEPLATAVPPQSATVAATVAADPSHVVTPTAIATLTESQLQSTAVPLTNTAVFEAYSATMDAMNALATGTAGASVDSVLTTTPTPGP